MKINKLLLSMLLACGAVRGDGGDDNVNSEGIQVNENGEVIGNNNDSRVSILDRIADNADQLRGEEFVNIVDIDKGITEPFMVQNAEGDQQTLEDNEAAAALEAAEAASVGQTALPKIKVNGQEVDLTPDMIAKAQKIAAADVYLAEAAKLRNDLAKQAAPAQPAAVPDQSEDLVALARAIQMGSEEEAVDALRKLQKPQGPSQDEVARTIDERMNFHNALNKYRENYADIVSDPVLNKLAQQRDEEFLRAGDNRPYYERYAAIGDELRSWVASKGGQTQQKPPAVAAQTSKEARKAAAASTPNTASVKSPSPPQDEGEESVQDVISKMAAARGGPQSMFGAPK